MNKTTLFFLFIVNLTFAQLIGNKDEMTSKYKDTSTTIYLDAGYFSIERTLASNHNFLNKPLGERANEIKSNLWSHSFGLVSPIKRNIFFEGGLSLIQNGEQYNWMSNSTDSTFNYTTKYRYLGMPLQVKFQSGRKISYFIGAGIQPQLYFGYRQNQTWTDSLGNAGDLTIKQLNNVNSFVISAIGSIGISLNFQNNVGIRFAANYRKQLTNSYSEYNGYIHKTSAIGFTIGLTRNI